MTVPDQWVLSFDHDGREIFRSVVFDGSQYFRPLSGVAYVIRVSIRIDVGTEESA
jgi:hypothetical protein